MCCVFSSKAEKLARDLGYHTDYSADYLSVDLIKYEDGVDPVNKGGVLPIALHKLSIFPTNPDVVISSDSYVSSLFRGRGIGAKKHRDMIAISKEANFKEMICVANDKNLAQVNILSKNNWVKISQVGESTCYIWKRSLV